jgi:hypothetical protein
MKVNPYQAAFILAFASFVVGAFFGAVGGMDKLAATLFGGFVPCAFSVWLTRNEQC